MKHVSTGSVYQSTLGYSRATVNGGWCFVSGVKGCDYTTTIMPIGVADQARNCFATDDHVLKQGGLSGSDIVVIQYPIVSVDLIHDLVPVLGEGLQPVRQAASMVVAGLLHPEMLVQIEVTAFKG